jgi:kumamolisin
MTEKLVQMKGSVPVNHHQLVGPVDPKERIEVTIKLRRKSEEGLPTLDQFIAGKRAVGVTRQNLGERYGAKQDDVTAVQRWATQQGLSVSRVDLARRQLHLVGSAEALARAFDVRLLLYKHSRTGTQFRCPEKDIHIPQKLVGVITGVFGLNDMPVVVRHGVRVARKAPASVSLQQQFPGTFYPNQVASLYNFPPTQGSGQRVAVLEFGGGFDPAVLASYFTKNIGLQKPPTVNAISVLDTKMQLNSPDTGEVYLDIEVIGAMAPQATLDVYFAPWTGEGYLNAMEQAIQNDDYAAISISYGLDEDLQGTAANPGWPLLNQNIDEAFRDATAIGLAIFVSSGDQGSSCLSGELANGEEITLYSKTAHTAYPASSPYAIACGGTMLYAANGSISKEIVWNELGELQQNKFYYGGATGGGVSDRYPAPSYQTSAGISLKSANSPATKGRCIPDVAGNAGVTTGYLVSQPPGSQSSIAPVGGTSAAAPMWTALLACVRASLGKTFHDKIPTFFFNDFVYASGKSGAFRDVVGGRKITYEPNQGAVPGAFTAAGNNRSTEVNGYTASEGYDLCTGWGSPNGTVLLQQLQHWLQSQKSS